MEQTIFNKASEIILTGDDKDNHDGNWWAYRDKTAQLSKHIVQSLSVIVGQFTKKMLDIMNQDINW